MDFNKEVFKEKFKNRLDEKYALDVKNYIDNKLKTTNQEKVTEEE